MKSLKEYSMNLPEQEYHDYPAWSHSLIARYAREGFSAITTLHDKMAATPSMEFGSLLDSILTRGKVTLEEYVIDNTAIPPAEKSVMDALLAAGHTEPYYELPESAIEEAINACPTFTSKYKKPETRLQKLSDASDYYDSRRTGKKVISKQDWDDAVEMARNIRNDEYLKTIFGTKNTEDMEYIYQSQFLVDYVLPSEKTIQIKIMPDLLVVNHKEKTIQPVDLKTSAQPGWDFKESFLRFRYDIEARVYSDVLAIVIDKDIEYKDYTILPYLFTDISRTDKLPVTYEYPQADISQENGFCYTIGEKTYQYKDWPVLMDEILTYEEQQAKVPSYIKTDGPNNILDILSGNVWK